MGSTEAVRDAVEVDLGPHRTPAVQLDIAAPVGDADDIEQAFPHQDLQMAPGYEVVAEL
jgi:hypothetical protein